MFSRNFKEIWKIDNFNPSTVKMIKFNKMVQNHQKRKKIKSKLCMEMSLEKYPI